MDFTLFNQLIACGMFLVKFRTVQQVHLLTQTNWYIFEILDERVKNICQEIDSSENLKNYWKGINNYNGLCLWIHEDQIPFSPIRNKQYNMKIEEYTEFREPIYKYKLGFKFVVTIQAEN